jgi:hypothetical protein
MLCNDMTKNRKTKKKGTTFTQVSLWAAWLLTLSLVLFFCHPFAVCYLIFRRVKPINHLRPHTFSQYVSADCRSAASALFLPNAVAAGKNTPTFDPCVPLFFLMSLECFLRIYAWLERMDGY